MKRKLLKIVLKIFSCILFVCDAYVILFGTLFGVLNLRSTTDYNFVFCIFVIPNFISIYSLLKCSVTIWMQNNHSNNGGHERTTFRIMSHSQKLCFVRQILSLLVLLYALIMLIYVLIYDFNRTGIEFIQVYIYNTLLPTSIAIGAIIYRIIQIFSKLRN